MPITKSKHVAWTDVVKPTEEDLVHLKKKFDLHPLLVQELRMPSSRTRVEARDGYLYFIYYFPIYDTTEGTSSRTEVDVIVTKNELVSVHYDRFVNIFEDADLHDAKDSLELTYRFLKQILTFEERQLRHIREKVEGVGKELFKNQERKVLEKINYLKRDISEYRMVIRLQEPILHSLLAAGQKFWGDETEIYLNDLLGEQAKIAGQLEDCREAVADFDSTNTQIMNLKTNAVMRTLTSLSLLTFPSMVFLALFTTGAHGTPIVDLRYVFWIIAGVLAVAIISLAVYFKRKDWL